MGMTIHINLSPEMESYIKAKVSSGFYGNATEVIRDAIRRMQAEDDRIAAFRKAVAEGEAELDRGEGVAYNKETLEEITREALDDNGEPIDSDVCPRIKAVPKGAQRLRRDSPTYPQEVGAETGTDLPRSHRQGVRKRMARPRRRTST